MRLLPRPLRQIEHQLFDKVLRTAPVEEDVLLHEVAFQVTARRFRVSQPFGFKLYGDVDKVLQAALTQRAALEREQALEQNAEVPLLQIKAQEQQRAVRHGFLD